MFAAYQTILQNVSACLSALQAEAPTTQRLLSGKCYLVKVSGAISWKIQETFSLEEEHLHQQTSGLSHKQEQPLLV